MCYRHCELKELALVMFICHVIYTHYKSSVSEGTLKKKISIKISLELASAPIVMMEKEKFPGTQSAARSSVIGWAGTLAVIELDSSLWRNCIYPAVTTGPISRVTERRLLHNMSSFQCLLKRTMSFWMEFLSRSSGKRFGLLFVAYYRSSFPPDPLWIISLKYL